MENTIVVGMGEALWDVLPEGKKIGGAPANFAYHVSQFGSNSRVVSAVGDDKLGMEILDNFREKKLNAMVEIVPYPTGTVQVELDAEGVPCYDIKEGVAWDNIPYTRHWKGWPGRPQPFVLAHWLSGAWFPEKHQSIPRCHAEGRHVESL